MAKLEKVVLGLPHRAVKGVNISFFFDVLRAKMEDLVIFSFSIGRQLDKDGHFIALIRQVLHTIFLNRFQNFLPVSSTDKTGAFQAADFFNGTEPDTAYIPWSAGQSGGHADKIIIKVFCVLLDAQWLQVCDVV